MKRKDNYIESKMQDEIKKSLYCMKDIIKLIVESQKKISEIDSPEWNNTDRIYEKAYTYDKIIESIKLYFPKELKEINE